MPRSQALDMESLSHDHSLVAGVIEAARAAGEIAPLLFRPGEKTVAGIHKKADGSPVTEADLAANLLLERASAPTHTRSGLALRRIRRSAGTYGPRFRSGRRSDRWNAEVCPLAIRFGLFRSRSSIGSGRSSASSTRRLSTKPMLPSRIPAQRLTGRRLPSRVMRIRRRDAGCRAFGLCTAIAECRS